MGPTTTIDVKETDKNVRDAISGSFPFVTEDTEATR